MSIFHDPDCDPVALYRAAKELLGTDIDNLEPETIRLVLKGAHGEVPRVNLDKLHAVRNLRTLCLAAVDAEVFENTVTAFNGVEPVLGVTQDCSLHQLAWGVDCIERVLQGMEPPVRWDAVVDREPAVYVAAMAYDAGVVDLPPELRFAQEAVDTAFAGHAGRDSEESRRRAQEHHDEVQAYILSRRGRG